MLSFDVIIWYYQLFYVIISHSLQMLSFFLVQDGCYHLCYHLMLSFFVIISPFFLFPENVTHSTLKNGEFPKILKKVITLFFLVQYFIL
jgi:hypothetical protein